MWRPALFVGIGMGLGFVLGFGGCGAAGLDWPQFAVALLALGVGILVTQIYHVLTRR